MIVITRKQIRSVLITLLILLLISLISLGLGVAEAVIIHRYFPDVEEYPWYYYSYRMMPAFSPAESGYSVYVDLDELKITLYLDGEVFKTYPVSGGAKNTPSPIGQWIVTDIGNWGEGFGGSWIGISCPWGQYGIHGTFEPWTIGNKNASKGCIRMKNSDVADLKQYMKWGTPVCIKYDGIPFRTMKNGSAGSDVLELQERLVELGYYSMTPDGKFGNGTESAVKSFQKDKNIKADGVVGWSTMDALSQADPPEQPETTGITEEPDTPEASDIPEVPDTPENSDTPQSPEVHQTLETSDLPE